MPSEHSSQISPIDHSPNTPARLTIKINFTMKASVLSVSCCFGLLWSLAAGLSIPRYFEKQPTTRRSLTSTQVQQELGGKLSKPTLIFGPDDARFNNVTSRWTEYDAPHIQVVIEPGSESDIAKIVRPMTTTPTRSLINPAC